MLELSSIFSKIKAALSKEELLSYHPIWKIEYKEELIQIISISSDNSIELHILENTAKLCALCGLFEFSEQILQIALQQNQNLECYYYFIALIQFKIKKLTEASHSIHQALQQKQIPVQKIEHIMTQLTQEQNQEYFPYLLQFCLNQLNINGFPNTFNPILFPNFITHTNTEIQLGYYYLFTEVCGSLEWQETGNLINFLQAEYQINGESYWYHLVMGKLHWVLQDRQKADDHFVKSKQLLLQKQVSPIHFDCGVFSWLTEQQIQQHLLLGQSPDLFNIQSWQWSYAPIEGPHPDLCLIFGCNREYFLFFPKLLLSLIKAHKQNNYEIKTVICLGLHNASVEQIQFLENVAAYIHQHIPNFYLTFAYGFAQYQEWAVFTCIRYLIAPAIFELYPTKTIIADIDLIFPDNFYERLAILMKNYDFGFRLFAFNQEGKQIGGEPWCLGATSLYLGSLEINKKIIQFLQLYINHAYNPENPTNWCIDQCALGQAFHYYIQPIWNKIKVKFLDNGKPLLIYAQDLGGKEQLYNHNGNVTIHNFTYLLDKSL